METIVDLRGRTEPRTGPSTLRKTIIAVTMAMVLLVATPGVAQALASTDDASTDHAGEVDPEEVQALTARAATDLTDSLFGPAFVEHVDEGQLHALFDRVPNAMHHAHPAAKQGNHHEAIEAIFQAFAPTIEDGPLADEDTWARVAEDVAPRAIGLSPQAYHALSNQQPASSTSSMDPLDSLEEQIESFQDKPCPFDFDGEPGIPPIFEQDPLPPLPAVDEVLCLIASLVGLALIAVLLVAGLVLFVAIFALMATVQLNAGGGIGEQYADTYGIVDAAEQALKDPDQDDGLTIHEYQWDTIPIPEIEAHDGDARVFENAQDYGGSNWMDGSEITYWSNYLDNVFEERLTQALTHDAHNQGPIEDDENNQATPQKPPTDALSWQDIVETLNEETDLAWRHPGLLLDTDGDGLPNVKDPDADSDRLLSGETLTVDRQDARYWCFAGQTPPEGPCDPYPLMDGDLSPDILHHEESASTRVFPGERTLGSYPEFQHSECLSTYPGSGMPTRCSESPTMEREGGPGAGTPWTDSEQYEHWIGLLDDSAYQDAYANVEEPWREAYDNDRVENALLDADSDNDGLTDYEEVHGCELEDGGECTNEDGYHPSYPWTDDSAGNDLNDWEERELGTHPLVWDHSGDELPDGWVAWYGFDPTQDNAATDTQGGLSMMEHYCWPHEPGDEACQPEETVNWCGPNPNLQDTSESGTPDHAEDRDEDLYDCTAPSVIVDDDPFTEPWARPNYDLGYLDPQSEEWLRTGQHAQSIAADPVNYTDRATTDPERVLQEIQENVTQDARILSRYVLPPSAHSELWTEKDPTLSKVHSLVDCIDDPLPYAYQGLEDAQDPIGTAQEARLGTERFLEEVVQHPVRFVDAGRADTHQRVEDADEAAMCLIEDTLRTADDALPPQLEPLASQGQPWIQDPLGQAQGIAPDALDPAPIEQIDVDDPTALALPPIDAPDALDAAPSFAEQSPIETALTDPWSLVTDPDRFPTFTSDVSENHATPEGLFDTIVTADEALGEDTGLVTTVDATHWDLLIGFPDGSYQTVQNTPLGTPRPIFLEEGCKNPLLANDTQEDLACTADVAEADLIVSMTPAVNPDQARSGYTLDVDVLHEDELSLLVVGLVQLPGEDNVLAMGADARPEGPPNASIGTELGPLPESFHVSVDAPTDGDGPLTAEMMNIGDSGPLALTGGLYPVDPHDPGKPLDAERERTDASLVMLEPPTSLHLTMDQGQDKAKVDWTATSPTPALAHLHHTGPLTEEGRDETVVDLSLEPLPMQGELTLERTETLTRLTQTHQALEGENIQTATLQAYAYEASNEETTLTDLQLEGPPATAQLLIDETDRQTRVDHTSTGPTDRISATKTVLDDAGGEPACHAPPDAPNVVLARDACTHVNLLGLMDASVTVTPEALSGSWEHQATPHPLAVAHEGDEDEVFALVEPWPRTGQINAAWDQEARIDWSLPQSIQALDVEFQLDGTGEGIIHLEGLPSHGEANVVPDEKRLSVEPSEPLASARILFSGDGSLPAPSETAEDYVLLEQRSEEALPNLNVRLHDVGPLEAVIEETSMSLMADTSADRAFQARYDDGEDQVDVFITAMPAPLNLDVSRLQGNITFEITHDGEGALPSLTARGLLEGLGFDVEHREVPTSVTGFLDTSTGSFKVDASSPLNLDAVLTGDPDTNVHTLPTSPLGSSVGMGLVESLEGLEPGVRMHVEDITHAKLIRSTQPDGLETVSASAHAVAPIPLRVSSVSEDATRFIDLDELPQDTRFTASFNDVGGFFDYEASHVIDEMEVASIEDEASYTAWASTVPTSLFIDWETPEEPLDETLTASIEHSGDGPLPEAGFQRMLDDDATDKRSVHAVFAEEVPSFTRFTLEDRHLATLETAGDERIGHVAGVLAEDMPPERVQAPQEGEHGINHQTTLSGDTSLGFRFVDVAPFEDNRFPTPKNPRMDVNVDLGHKGPLVLRVDDDEDALTFHLGIEETGGGPIQANGNLVFGGGEDASFDITAGLPTSPGSITAYYENKTLWADASLETHARDVSVKAQTGDTMELSLEGDEGSTPVNVELDMAPTGQPSPVANATSENHAIVDLAGPPRANVTLNDLTRFELTPGGSGTMAWTASEPRETFVQFLNESVHLRELRIQDLPGCCSASWSVVNDSFDLDLDIPIDASISEIHLDASYTPTGDEEEGNESVRVLANASTWRGPGNVFVDADERVTVEADQGIQSAYAQVLFEPLTQVGIVPDVDILDEDLGIVYDAPAMGDHEAALVFHVDELTSLHATFDQPEEGGILVDAELELLEPLSDELRVRVVADDAWMDANATHVPRQTELFLDTRDLPEDEREAPVTFRASTSTPVPLFDGAYRFPFETSQGERVITGSFAVEELEGFVFDKHGAIEKDLHLRAGGDAEGVTLRADEDDHRVRVNLEDVGGVYDAMLLEAGKNGTITLDEGDPVGHARIEYKKQDADMIEGTADNHLLAIANSEDDGDPIDYAHVLIQEPTHVAWSVDGEHDVNATVETRQPTDRSLLVKVHHEEHQATLPIQIMPARATLAYDAEPFYASFETTHPLHGRATLETLNRDDDGVPDEEARSLDTSMTTRFEGLGSSTITLDQNPHRLDMNATVDTAGLDALNLAGIHRSSESNVGQADHLILDVQGVPETTINVDTFDPWPSTEPQVGIDAPFVNASSTNPIEHIHLSHTRPVEEKPLTYETPELKHENWVHAERAENEEGLTQDILQANATHITNLAFDPTRSPENCERCQGATVHLDHEGDAGLSMNIDRPIMDYHVDGRANAASIPHETDLAIGWTRDFHVIEDEVAFVHAYALEHDADGPIEDLTLDAQIVKEDADEEDVDEETIRVEGMIDRFPSNAEALLYKDSSKRDEANPACGVPLFEKVPGRLILDAGDVDDRIEGLDIQYASGATTYPTPGQWPGSFLGWVTNSDEDTLSVHAKILETTGGGMLDVTRDEGMNAHLDLDQLDPLRVTYDDQATNAMTNITLQAGEGGGNVHYTCNDAREHEAWAGEKDKSSFKSLARATVHTDLADDTEFEFFDQRVETLQASLTDLEHGVTLDAAPVSPDSGKEAAGLIAEPMTSQASLGSLHVNANLAAPTRQEEGDCRDALGDDSSQTTPVHVDWRLPIEEQALVSFSTEPFLDNMPETDAWTRITDRCDAKTLDLQVNGVNDLRFDQYGSLDIEASMELEEPQSYVLRLFDYDQGQEQDRRLVVDEIPLEFSFKIEPGIDFRIAQDPRVFMGGTQDIEMFSYIVDGCHHVWMKDIDMKDDLELILGIGWDIGALTKFGDAVTNRGGCMAVGAIQVLEGNVQEIGTHISDGVRSGVAHAEVTGAWSAEGDEEAISLYADIYGWMEERSLPRFQGYTGTFLDLTVEFLDDEHDRGGDFSLTDITERHGPVSMDGQIQWRENPGSTSPDVIVNGTLVPPSGLWDRRCLRYDWGGNCENRESNQEVAERLAESWFHHRAGIFESSGSAVPGEAWYEVLQPG